MINHYDNESRLTEILRCVVDQTTDAAMLQQLGPARTREEIFVSRALGKKPWAAIPPRTTLEMWLAFIAGDTAEPAPGSYTVRSCAESCVITYARRVKGATAIVPIFPPHDPYEIALAKLAGIIPAGYGVQGRPWELLINQLAEQGPRENVYVIYGSTPRHEDSQISPMQDFNGYDHPWPGGGGVNQWNPSATTPGYYTSNGGIHAPGDAAEVMSDFIPITGTSVTSGFFGYATGEQKWGGAAFFDADKNFISRNAGTISDPWSIRLIQVPEGAAYFRGMSRTYGHDHSSLFACNGDVTTYSPYENLCPITPGLDMLRDNGDRLVVWSGEINTGAGEIISRSAEIASYAGEQLPGPWISSMDVYDPDATPTIGAQVVYELAEPVIYRLSPAELQRALGCAKYLGVGAWKLCPGVVTVISAKLTTGKETDHYDIAPSTAEGWTFEISVDGQTATGAAGALSVEAGYHSITITATPAAGAAACYIQPTLYSEVAP